MRRARGQGVCFRMGTGRLEPQMAEPVGEAAAVTAGFGGYALAWHRLSEEFLEVMVPGAVTPDNIRTLLAEGFVGGLQHDWRHPIGRISDAQVDDSGLYVRCGLVGTAHAEEVGRLVAAGVVQRMSVAYHAREWLLTNAAGLRSYWAAVEYEPNSTEVAVLERVDPDQDILTLILRAEVVEVSPVVLGANPGAIITEARAAGG